MRLRESGSRHPILNHVNDVAVNQLGMVYASSDQIMYYEIANDDYMNQYSDIPSK